ncbi:hypothetical protein OHA46_13955 [Streptomyces sp. NBC_00708]
MNAINRLTNRAAVSLGMVLAVLADRVERGTEDRDRGDVSITTVIIWVAAVAGALIIAGTIKVVLARYNTQLSGI